MTDAATDVDDLQNGLGSLVIGLADVIRLIMQKQAIRRLESETLNDDEVSRLNQAFYALSSQMRDIKTKFGLDPDEDISLHLGDLDGHEVNVADILDSLLAKGVVLKSDLSLEIAQVPLAEASLTLILDEPKDQPR